MAGGTPTRTRYDIKTKEYATLRKAGGAYVASARKAQGLSQVALARKLGLEFHTFISQVETGARRIPPEDIETWARALHIDVQELARNLMKFYDPVMYRLVFRDGSDAHSK